MKIELTQFVRPNGSKKTTYAEVSDDLKPKVESILGAGLEFTCELLPGQRLALYISDGEQDFAVDMATNGPGPKSPTMVLEGMIRGFNIDNMAMSGFVSPPKTQDGPQDHLGS